MTCPIPAATRGTARQRQTSTPRRGGARVLATVPLALALVLVVPAIPRARGRRAAAARGPGHRPGRRPVGCRCRDHRAGARRARGLGQHPAVRRVRRLDRRGGGQLLHRGHGARPRRSAGTTRCCWWRSRIARTRCGSATRSTRSRTTRSTRSSASTSSPTSPTATSPARRWPGPRRWARHPPARSCRPCHPPARRPRRSTKARPHRRAAASTSPRSSRCCSSSAAASSSRGRCSTSGDGRRRRASPTPSSAETPTGRCSPWMRRSRTPPTTSSSRPPSGARTRSPRTDSRSPTPPAELRTAFEIRQRLDDAEPEPPPEQERMLQEIVARHVERREAPRRAGAALRPAARPRGGGAGPAPGARPTARGTPCPPRGSRRRVRPDRRRLRALGGHLGRGQRRRGGQGDRLG